MTMQRLILLLLVAISTALRLPSGNRRPSFGSRSTALSSSSQQQGNDLWQGIRSFVGGKEKKEEKRLLPAWKLLESEELAKDVAELVVKDDAQNDSMDDFDQDHQSTPAEGFEFDDLPNRRGLFGRLTDRVGGAGQAVAGGAVQAARRVWPWSDRNKMIRTQKRLENIERAYEGETEAASEQPGPLGRVGRTFRRRLLNIFDFGGEEAEQWAKTLSKRDSDIRSSPGAMVGPDPNLEEEFALLRKQFQAVEYTRASDLPVPS